MKRYPIDGLWLTDAELGRYFLGQLEIESHMRVRSVEPYEPPAIVEPTPAPKPTARQAPPIKGEGISL